MKIGYYVSLYAETLQDPVIPTCNNILDAYRTPVLLLRAKKKGIPTPPFVLTNSTKEIIYELGFPLVVFPSNPFSSDGYRIVYSQGGLYKALKSFGINYNYPVCAEALLGEVRSVKCIFGEVNHPDVANIGLKFYEEFGIPICKLYIQTMGKECFLCSVSPLKTVEIHRKDIQRIKEKLKELAQTIG
jgi:hypothetical protein